MRLFSFQFITHLFSITSTMLSKSFVLLFLIIWVVQCSATLKNQTLLAVKKPNNQISIEPKRYALKQIKPGETIIGRGKYIDSTNGTGYVIFL